MKNQLKKEFIDKFIGTTKFDEQDCGIWEFKNIHFLDIIKWIDENFVSKTELPKMPLSDEEIESHIWEHFPEGLSCEDIRKNTEPYKRYLQIVELVKGMRYIP